MKNNFLFFPGVSRSFLHNSGTKINSPKTIKHETQDLENTNNFLRDVVFNHQMVILKVCCEGLLVLVVLVVVLVVLGVVFSAPVAAVALPLLLPVLKPPPGPPKPPPGPPKPPPGPPKPPPGQLELGTIRNEDN